jgi:hypothetical protein
MNEAAPKRFVPVFIDWKPDENLEPGDQEKLCMVGLIASSQNGMPGLTAYKRTRTKKRKLKQARELSEYLARESIEVDVVAVSGMSNGIYAQWSCGAINRIRPKIGAKWKVEGNTPVSLLWNDDVYPRANVLGISLYAGMLPIVALRAKMRLEATKQPEKHVKLCLDRLPLDAEAGIRLLNAFYQDDDIGAMWRDTCTGGYSFHSGMLESFVDSDGTTQSGKSHPNSMLVDWMAQACMATIAPGQFQSENNFSEAEVAEIAAIWEAANSQPRGSARVTDVDDPELMKRVAQHWKDRNGKL